MMMMTTYQTHDKNIGEAKLEAASRAREGGPPVLPFQDVWVKPEHGDGDHHGDRDGGHDDGELQKVIPCEIKMNMTSEPNYL